ncbi:alanine racemase, N-terminal domain protein [Ochrobactrum quorumnocens]|uniref:Alanine racemase, N-terminal domain protein n=1 Tax=Ochrobactrum quorumnocens TaxID=271865 RepID=A0A248UAE3_9HYPH|nr:alanine racemase, N-terminal domain protein [[Ochrobactrum] quorumnocens]
MQPVPLLETTLSDLTAIEAFNRPIPVDLPTPYVEIDDERLMQNLKGMQRRADQAGVVLRPHIKTHKNLTIAQRQLELGAIGVTASKPEEALVFVEGGVPSVTLAYPIVRPESIDRLVRSAKVRQTELLFIAAHDIGVEAIGAAAQAHGVKLGVFLKVDVGLGRVGVKPQDPAAERLAHRIAKHPHLTFEGLLSHAGHSYGSKSAGELANIANAEAQALLELAEQLKKSGVEVAGISVGATPTCLGAPIPAGITEIRPGNYAFLDRTALRLGITSADDMSLSVIATVVAHNDYHFIVDAGSKSLSSDLGAHGSRGSGFGIAVGVNTAAPQTWEVERLSEEHGFVRCSDTPPAIGSRVRIFPNHSCAVVAQFDRITLRQSDGRPCTLWTNARGRQT